MMDFTHFRHVGHGRARQEIRCSPGLFALPGEALRRRSLPAKFAMETIISRLRRRRDRQGGRIG